MWRKVNVIVLLTTLTVINANYHVGFRFQRLQRTVLNETNVTQEESNTEESERSRNLTAIRLANEHFIRIRREYRCRTPRPKLIHVKDFYDVPSKEYLPRCTVLHQCDDESGCCELSSMRCAAQETQTIALYFYALNASARDNNSRGSGTTEVLTFVNHTKCHCVDINYMPRSRQLNNTTHRSAVEHKNSETTSSTTTTTTTTSTTATPLIVAEQHISESHSQMCKWVDCPKPFHSRIRHSDQKCICDCFDKDTECIKVKSGKKRLGPTANRCVRAGICVKPECELGGHFDAHEGTCVLPKHVNSSSKQRSHALRHHHHKHEHRTQHWLAERD